MATQMEVLPALPPQDKAAYDKDSTSLKSRVATLEVIDPKTYAVADALLGKVRAARAWVSGKTQPFLDHANQGLKLARDFKHSMDDPLQDMEASIKAKMNEYQEQLRRQALEAAEKARIEAHEKYKAAEALKKKEEAAKTQAMRDRLKIQREQMEREAEDASVPEPVALPSGVNSTTRTAKDWTVVDIEKLMRAALDPASDVPMDVFQVNSVLLNKFFRSNQEAVAKWPGVEVREVTKVVGRGM